MITSQPVAVTTTSSSIRAAERPSVAAQYVSSAKTIPSSSSTGWSSECTREIIGDSYRPTPIPWPNWSPKHVSSSGKPSSSAVGQTSAILSVVMPGRTSVDRGVEPLAALLVRVELRGLTPPTLNVR